MRRPHLARSAPPRMSASNSVLGNTQEHFHAVERALPDCEVLLHSPSILWWIVARRKRPYIRLANRYPSSHRLTDRGRMLGQQVVDPHTHDDPERSFRYDRPISRPNSNFHPNDHRCLCAAKSKAWRYTRESH